MAPRPGLVQRLGLWASMPTTTMSLSILWRSNVARLGDSVLEARGWPPRCGNSAPPTIASAMAGHVSRRVLTGYGWPSSLPIAPTRGGRAVGAGVVMRRGRSGDHRQHRQRWHRDPPTTGRATVGAAGVALKRIAAGGGRAELPRSTPKVAGRAGGVVETPSEAPALPVPSDVLAPSETPVLLPAPTLRLAPSEAPVPPSAAPAPTETFAPPAPRLVEPAMFTVVRFVLAPTSTVAPTLGPRPTSETDARIDAHRRRSATATRRLGEASVRAVVELAGQAACASTTRAATIEPSLVPARSDTRSRAAARVCGGAVRATTASPARGASARLSFMLSPRIELSALPRWRFRRRSMDDVARVGVLISSRPWNSNSGALVLHGDVGAFP